MLCRNPFCQVKEFSCFFCPSCGKRGVSKGPILDNENSYIRKILRK